MSGTTFTGINLTTDNPPGICPACAVHGVKHEPSGSTYVYCEHSQTGTVRRPDQHWVLFESSSLDTFKKLIVELVLSVEIAADIVGDDSTGATFH